MEFCDRIDGIMDNLAPVRTVSPEEGHYFFGYYDLCAYSKDGKRHLAHRVPFIDRDKGPDDEAVLGIIDTDTRTFHPLRQNNCWCFQQGSMLQYLPAADGDTIAYNVFDAQGGIYRTVKEDLQTGEKKQTTGALATISRDGTHGLSVNFSRIWDFRRGYGYCNMPDPYRDVPSPEEDGVFFCDFEGNRRLIVSYARLAKEFPIPGKTGAKFVVNHITLNPSGTRFLMLLRNFQTEQFPHWSTSCLTGDMDGNMRLIVLDSSVSHYWWQDDTHFIAWGASRSFFGQYPHCALFRYEDSELCYIDPIGSDLLSHHSDVHCSLSPDGRYLIGDDYPLGERTDRQIRIEDLSTGKSAVLLRAKTIKPADGEIRCDLHARFDRAGSRISFDTTHAGKREICEVDMKNFSL